MGYKEDIAREKLRIREVTNDVIIDVTLRIHGTLVSNPPDGTPIDKGWASVNWFIAVGEPTTGNTGKPSTSSPSASVATRQALQDRSVAQLVSTYDYTRGQTVHVGNNVAYIARLNDGWSEQSPAGFVDDAIQEAVVWANSR